MNRLPPADLNSKIPCLFFSGVFYSQINGTRISKSHSILNSISKNECNFEVLSYNKILFECIRILNSEILTIVADPIHTDRFQSDWIHPTTLKPRECKQIL